MEIPIRLNYLIYLLVVSLPAVERVDEKYRQNLIIWSVAPHFFASIPVAMQVGYCCRSGKNDRPIVQQHLLFVVKILIFPTNPPGVSAVPSHWYFER